MGIDVDVVVVARRYWLALPWPIEGDHDGQAAEGHGWSAPSLPIWGGSMSSARWIKQIPIVEPINSDVWQRSQSERRSPTESPILLSNKCARKQRIITALTATDFLNKSVKIFSLSLRNLDAFLVKAPEQKRK
jgi:hypothetical protein